MNNEFSDLIITIDSREKKPNRIESVRSFFEERGACVDFGAISINEGQITSMDYALEGSYKDKTVSLGISAKTLIDFSSSLESLPNELARGYLRFDEIGFVLITGSYETTLSSDSLHAIIKNSKAIVRNQDDRADILNTTSMYNALESWQMSGVHCRQIIYEEQFSQAVMSILNYITKDDHRGIEFDTKQYSESIIKSKQELKAKLDFSNAHIHMGIDKLGVKTALKLRDYLISHNYPPNLHFASSLSEEDLQDAIGKKIGSSLYQAYNCKEGYKIFESSSGQGNNQTKIESLPPEYTKNTEVLSSVDTNISKNKEKPLKSNPEQFYKDELEYLNHNIHEYHEVTPRKIQKLKSSHDASTNLKVSGRNNRLSNAEVPIEQDAIIQGSDKIKADLCSQSLPSGTNESHTIPSSSEKPNPVGCDSPVSKENRTLLSSEGTQVVTPPSNDMVEGSFSKQNTTIIHLPSTASTKKFHEIKSRETVKTLEDAIIDRVYEKPEMATVVMREFVDRGFKMPEVHHIFNNSKKIRKYKQGDETYLSYCGVREDKELDVGV